MNRCLIRNLFIRTRRLGSSSGFLCLILTFSCLSPAPVSAHSGLHEQIEAVTKQIRANPNDADLYLLRGDLNRLHRDWKAAEKDYARALKLNPQREEVNLARALMLMDQNRAADAKAVLDRFLTQRPNHVNGWITRARVFLKLK